MKTSQMKEYNGVVFVPQRVSEVIRAKSLEAAKSQMRKKHGPEREGSVTRWVCGLSSQSFTGHAVRRPS